MSDTSDSAMQQAREKAVLENLKWIDRVLWAQVAIALTVILSKLLGVSTFAWHGPKFNVSSSWIIFLALTVAHLYSASLFIRSVRVYKKSGASRDSEKLLFTKISGVGGLFVRGLVARAEHANSFFGLSYYKMRASDPSAWAALVAIYSQIASIGSFVRVGRWELTWVAALLIAELNWVIGTNWIVAASTLHKASPLNFWKQGNRLRFFLLKSGGGVDSKGVHPLAVPFWLILNFGVFLFSLLSLLFFAIASIFHLLHGIRKGVVR